MASTVFVDQVTPIMADWLNQVNDWAYHTTVSVSSTTYTPSISDFNLNVLFTASSAIAYTVPLNTTVAFPLGTLLSVIQYGTGKVTVTGAVGVTIGNVDGFTKSKGQYAVIYLQQVAANVWILYGDTGA